MSESCDLLESLGEIGDVKEAGGAPPRMLERATALHPPAILSIDQAFLRASVVKNR